MAYFSNLGDADPVMSSGTTRPALLRKAAAAGTLLGRGDLSLVSRLGPVAGAEAKLTDDVTLVVIKVKRDP